MAPIRTAARFLRSVPSPLPSPTCANPAPLHSADSKRDKRTARHNSWIDKLVRQSHSRVAKKTVGKSIKSPTKGNALLMDDLKDLVSELETEVAALAGQRNVDRSDCPKSLPRKSTASLSQKKRRRLGYTYLASPPKSTRL